MIKKIVLSLIAVGLIAVGSLWAYFIFSEQGNGISYEQKEVKRADVESVVIATGALEPVNTVIVGTEVSGQISELLADFNDAVTADQVIARIDPRTFEARHLQRIADVESAKANLVSRNAELTRAKSNLRTVKSELERRQELATDGHASPQELEQGRNSLDQALAALDIAQASITSAEANLTQAEASLAQAVLDLDRTYIRSPINGTVINRAVEIGQTVAASFSAPELFVIAQDLHEMKVEASVDEADVGRLRRGLPTRFSVDAFPDREFSGRVTQIRKSPNITQSVVTYKVIITASNDDLALFPGMTANVEMVLGKREDVLTVPTSALRYTPRESGNVTSTSASSASGGSNARSGGGMGQRPGSGSSAARMSPEQRASELGRQLDLSETQVSQVAEIYEEMSNRMRSMFASASQSGGSPFSGGSDMRQRMQNLMNATNLDISEILEDDQLVKFEEMTNMRGGNQQTVYMLDPDGQEIAKPVFVGLQDDSSAEILRGLDEGDMVIVRARRVSS